jgi:branched-chain amino acid transport system permease protein
MGLTPLVALLASMGLFVRAASTDPVTTAMQGVQYRCRCRALVVGLGTALAGLAGVVAAPFLSLSPSMSSRRDHRQLRGRRGRWPGQRWPGAFIAAMVLGMVQALGAVWLPDTCSACCPFAC